MTVDGRTNGLSVQGYPLRKIVDRANRIHTLSCGHKLPKPEPDQYDLRKSRRCVECGPNKKSGALTLTGARDELRRMFLDASFISVKRVEFIDLRSAEPHVSFTMQVDNYGTSPEDTLDAAMEHMRRLHQEQS